MSKAKLTEEEKRAISLNLGHAHVGTTFGAYGYGSMSQNDAIDIVQKIKLSEGNGEFSLSLTEEEKVILERVLKRF